MNKYDSYNDTTKHIDEVTLKLNDIISEINVRVIHHDTSKLNSPEKEIFDEVTPLLKTLTYNSDEYKIALQGMGPALKHHYENNRHHPEHFEQGIKEMNLIDIIEMLADWKAATLRMKDGDIYKSIEINQKRFGYGSEMKQLLWNTARYLNY